MREDPAFMEAFGWQYLLRSEWSGWWAFEWMLLWIEQLRASYLRDHPEEAAAWQQWLEKNRRPDNEDERSYRCKDIPASLRKEIMERDAYRCQECDTWKDLTIDHIKPVSKGGDNHPDNLRALCHSCNSWKGNRL